MLSVTGTVGPMLHVPGTLFSPWTHAYYTPLYYSVTSDGVPESPDHEPVEISFRDPAAALASAPIASASASVMRWTLSASTTSAAQGANSSRTTGRASAPVVSVTPRTARACAALFNLSECALWRC